jgi:acetyltransferase-like isoleucine patch superfamily enzyme
MAFRNGYGIRPRSSRGKRMSDFAREGVDVRIFPGARLLGRERIAIGSHVVIDDFVFIGNHAELVLGSYVHVASHASITGGGVCRVGDFAGISSGARILTGTDDFGGSGLTGPTVPLEFRAVERGTVTIESHVVIGANAVVLPNVTVGEGAVVGAGSVVTRDLAPWFVYVGAPARPVKARRSDLILAQERELYQRYGRSDGSTRLPPGLA